MWKTFFASLTLTLLAACATSATGPVNLTVRSDDAIAPSVSDDAAWAKYTPWGSFAVTALPGGANYIALANGDSTASAPTETISVAVYYQVRLAGDGTILDDSFGEADAPILDMRDVVPGWRDALTQMHPGDRWLIYIPAASAYGKDGSGNVPPNADLIFEVKLLGVTG